MPVKSLRLEIVKPCNTDRENPTTWNELGQLFRDLRRQSSKIANFVIQKCYEWEMFRQDYKKLHGVYPSAKDYKDRHYIYPMVREAFPDVAANILNQVRQHAEKTWQRHCQEVLALRQSIPSFRLNFPICVYAKGWSLHKTENAYYVSAGMRPQGAAKTRFQFIVKPGEKSKQAILDKIIGTVYKTGALQIVSDRKNKWYCLIPYEFTAQERRAVPGRTMGVCLGAVHAAYWAYNDSRGHGKISGKEIEAFIKRGQERRRALQQQRSYCGDGRIGHGVKRRIKPVEALLEREENFRVTTNHRYARKIVDEAVKHCCEVIQIEELAGIRKAATFLKHWPYYDLQQKIVEKAMENGIRVIRVDPECTAERCSQCGYIDEKNRTGLAAFCCARCGYGTLYHCFGCGADQRAAGICLQCGAAVQKVSIHADYNTARNIATPGIEAMIKADRSPE